MRVSALSVLRCPYCQSEYRIAREISLSEGELIDGILECGCRQALVLRGIPILKLIDQPVFQRVYAALEKGKPDLAWCELLREHCNLERGAKFLSRAGFPFVRFGASFLEKSSCSHIQAAVKARTFHTTLTHLRLGEYGYYFLSRFSTDSFLSFALLAALIRETEGPVLELGCGMGHMGYYLTRQFPQRQGFFVDVDPMNLFCAKKFFAPEGEFICADLNYDLPFQDGVFGAVMSSDALHYVSAKALAIREAERALSLEGVLILSHLHNKEQSNPTPGTPLDAEGYSKLFNLAYSRLYCEESLLSNFLHDAALDLEYEENSVRLSSARAFSAILSRSDKFFHRFSDIDELIFTEYGNVRINPLYVPTTSSGGLVGLAKKWRSVLIRSENPIVDSLMPPILPLDENLYERIKRRELTDADGPVIADLRRKCVVLDVPRDY